MTFIQVEQSISTVIYSFYVESNSVGSTGLSPIITAMINIENGSSLPSASIPTISELSEGFYKFSYAWYASNPDAYLLKIDTGLTTPAERFITMRIEKTDYLEFLVDDIKSTADTIETSANSIQASATTIQQKVQNILDIEQGEWRISNNQLIITSADGETVLGTFDLRDENDQPTSTNPFIRRPVSVS